MELDILVLAAHPDDAELSCSGTLIKHIRKGYRVGVMDYTRGELGTRGTPETRLEEAAKASKIMGLTVRGNLRFEDGFFDNDQKHQLEVIRAIRMYRPKLILANAIHDRHPDHARAAQLTVESVFKSGLKKIVTKQDGQVQAPWRPQHIFHFIQSRYIEPDFLVDVSDCWEEKIRAIYAYETQFHVPGNDNSGDQTFISTPDFIQFIEARAREYGKSIGVTYAEGFTKAQPFGVDDLLALK